MRYLFLALLFAATPAFAWIKVTNLSGTPQSVTLSNAGSQITKEIAPDATAYFNQNSGMLALNGAAAKAKAQSAKPGALGAALGDVVAANRTEGIPAKDGSNFVIWSDGRLTIQHYQRTAGFAW